MLLQDTILRRLDVEYPNATLKKISKLTGIQVTRLFRIMNGYEMKISEYNSIDKILRKSELKQSYTEHLDLYEKYLSLIPLHEQEILEYKYQRRIEFSKFISPLGLLDNNKSLYRSNSNAKH